MRETIIDVWVNINGIRCVVRQYTLIADSMEQALAQIDAQMCYLREEVTQEEFQTWGFTIHSHITND